MSPRSQANISSPSASPMASRSRPSVAKPAWAATSSARRCRGLGTSAAKQVTNRCTTSGTASRSSGAPPPASLRWDSTSSSRESASGWPWVTRDRLVVEVVGDAGARRRRARHPGRGCAATRRAAGRASRDRAATASPGRVAAGDHGDRAGRQRGDEVLAQPLLQAARPLERVEQQQGPSPAASASAGGPPPDRGPCPAPRRTPEAPGQRRADRAVPAPAPRRPRPPPSRRAAPSCPRHRCMDVGPGRPPPRRGARPQQHPQRPHAASGHLPAGRRRGEIAVNPCDRLQLPAVRGRREQMPRRGGRASRRGRGRSGPCPLGDGALRRPSPR